MELNSEIEVRLENNKSKKIKCYKFKVKELKREFALHADVENKQASTVSDVITGFKAFNIRKKSEEVKQEEINDRIEEYIKHYTASEILSKLKEIEGNINGK